VDSYKSRGEKTVDVSWAEKSEVIYLYRDGSVITSSDLSGTSYSETLGKGGGSYVYKICLADGVTCSPEESVVF
jgi:hypothetical protein